MSIGQMRRFFVGCYLSLFTTPITTTTTSTLATLALPFAAGFHPSIGSVSALRIRSISSSMTTSHDSAAADLAEGADDLFDRSPLIRSQPLSALAGKPVYLKLDALQASGSFKASRSIVENQFCYDFCNCNRTNTSV